MANRIVSVHAGIYGMGIYAIMLPSSGFSVAHCSRIVARNDESTHIYYERYHAIYHSMFSDNLLVFIYFYRGNEKYVLVLVQCHDGMITNSINLVCVLHSSSTRARPNRFISFVIIVS